ncbi:Syntaxin-43 [Glycine max]|nr:Syntaxin-43 [Glycine max]
MATRNRTLEFRKHRDAVKSVRAPLSSSASSPVIEMVTTSLLPSNRSSYAPLSTQEHAPSTSRDAFTVGLPPSWVDDSEEIATNIQRARVRISELTKAHAKALMPSFGDGKEDQRHIETLTQEITSLLRKSEVRLKRLSAAAGSSEDSNVRKNVQRSHATDLQNLSMDLRRKQSAYLKHLQQQQEGYDGVDLEMNFNGSKFVSHNDEFSDVVVKSVHELAQIMKDLSVLVIDQGTIVDRIDYNIQSVSTSVEEGLKQLQKPVIIILNTYLCTTGRENTEKRRDGYVCINACYNVLCHASSLDTQGDSLLVVTEHFTGRHHVNSSVQ